MDEDTRMIETHAQKAAQVTIYLMTALYPLILPRADLGGIHIQSLILLLSVMGILLYYFFLIRINELALRKRWSRIDIVVILLVVFEMIRMLGKVLKGGYVAVYFDGEIVILSLAVLYLILTTMPVFDEKYFDAVIFSGLLVFGFLLFQYLCSEGRDSAADLFMNKNETASYTILVCSIGLLRYCRCRDSLRSVFYAGVLTIGFFVLFINGSLVGIFLMSVVFLSIPIFLRPTAELFRRDMQMFFLYLLLLSNMSLLSTYTDLAGRELPYSLKQSVYLDMLIAAGGVFFFHSWEKIPEGTDLKRLVMRKMQRSCEVLLSVLGVLFMGILVSGDNWRKFSEVSETSAVSALKEFAILLTDEIRDGESAFYLCIREQGIAGVLLVVMVCTLIGFCLWKNYSVDKPNTSMLILISAVFLIQLFFWQISVNALPSYFIFLIFAAFYKEESIRVTSTKIKLEQKEIG